MLSLSLFPATVPVRVAGWWSLSFAFYCSGTGGWVMLCVKVGVAGWWSPSLSLSFPFYR